MRSDRPREGVAQLFPGLLGLWVALGPIKFGTPVILDHYVATPTSWLEMRVQAWPVAWAYVLSVLVFACGCLLWKWLRTAPRVVLALPAAWLVCQLCSASQSVRPDLTPGILVHFVVCGAAFYLGAFALGDLRHGRALWLSVAGGWLVVVLIGWKQHFGGLAEMREFFYAQTNWRDQPPEFIAKIASSRISSTLFYPNALAGALLLFTPVVIATVWSIVRASSLPKPARLAVAMMPVLGAGACLLWSGSKAGWLIALGQIVLALAGLLLAGWAPPPVPATRSNPVGKRALSSPGRSTTAANAGGGKVASASTSPAGRTALRVGWLILIVAVAVAGMGGFWLRYRSYFKKGATSVSARFDYWAVAGSNALARPLLGSGPGTFQEVYRRGKPPQAEMTRLVHNDYLQQASDSGFPSALLLAALVGATLWLGAPVGRNRRRHPIEIGVWLGVAGIAVQSTIEFGLYIPGIAWPWFLAMGSLVRYRNGS